jgi:hypothetical protein
MRDINMSFSLVPFVTLISLCVRVIFLPMLSFTLMAWVSALIDGFEMRGFYAKCLASFAA